MIVILYYNPLLFYDNIDPIFYKPILIWGSVIRCLFNQRSVSPFCMFSDKFPAVPLPTYIVVKKKYYDHELKFEF